jgi:signal transduction histidine kinase/CheY-like chemotaxis protein/HPt (histidine-containing phosphotransfer) domain-containing protein
MTTSFRGWSVRTLALACLLPFAIIPALLVGWVLYRSHVQTIDTLSEKIVTDVAQRVRMEIESQLGMANTVLNGLLDQEPTPIQLERARRMMKDPALFESVAHTLVRMNPQTPFIYMGTFKGEFLGVQMQPSNSQGYHRVGVQSASEDRRRYYETQVSGDRSRPVAVEEQSFNPRLRPWYTKAIQERLRVTTPVYVSASSRQLVISMAQPVFDEFNGSLGVFGVDLTLRELNDALRLVSISRRGAAFIVDNEGMLVASSAGDDLYRYDGTTNRRVSPDQSANPVIREAWRHMAATALKRSNDSVSRAQFSGKVDTTDGTMLVAMRSFGNEQNLPLALIIAAPELDFAEEAERSLQQSLLLLLAVLAVGTVLATALALRLSKRLRGLTAAAEAVGQGQVPVLPRRIQTRELRQLAFTLRDSAQEIVNSRQALLQANEQLEQRVVQRTEQLAIARDDALAAARAKAAFLATMSHEIRTPLNGVVGMTTLMADTPLNDEQHDYLHTMRVSSDQLLAVINDILDYSKIESGKLDIESEPLNLLATIEEACDMAASRAREKGLELLVDASDELPAWVRGDVTRLRQVLLNFINNAIKFTEQGQIVLSAQMREDFDASRGAQSGALIEFRVKDTGIGIPTDRQGALFQSFTQVDASTTRKYGGTGLGLAICKRLAELMGGSVGLESEVGQGSTFWFTARLHYADPPVSSESSLVEMASLADKLAVIIDDTPLNLRILDKQLKRWKMQTVIFERAPAALDWLASNHADVIVTDMHMPEMDGHDFAVRVRMRDPKAHIVLLTSGVMPTGEAAKPFDARLLKPYRQAQLFNALTRVTHQSHANPPALSAAPSKNQLILVADDNAVNLKVAVSMLAKLGYESATALNGQEAADLVGLSLQAEGRPFAAILMDANMPVMDGFVASRLILSTHGDRSPPIIALTASVLEEDRQRCFDAGMIGFLPKPLRIDELSEALARHARAETGAATIIAAALHPATANGPASAEAAQASGLMSGQVLMDWSRLEQFKEFDDDERTMTREVIALFVDDAPRRMHDISAAYKAHDTAALSRATHALKGSASNVGASALTDACFSLEQASKQGIWPDDIDAQVALISSLTQQTIDALKDFTLS